ncbi:arsenate reductase ArsC [Thermaurantiacus sp.]
MRNLLFLCTGNSARSILAEAILNRLGEGRWRGFSAGSRPLGRVNPRAVALLEARGHPTAGLASKGWELFAADDAPRMDAIITVCDSAAGEACPVWPGHPLTAHWGMPDPAAVAGDERAAGAAFEAAYDLLHRRITALLAIPLEGLSPAEAKAAIGRIGEETPPGLAPAPAMPLPRPGGRR